MRFEGIIKRACQQEGQSVVILVDEYDKPMLQAIGDDVLQKSFRNTLKAFYGALKSQDGCIKFALLTGTLNNTLKTHRQGFFRWLSALHLLPFH